jgi:hypothetical protein
MYSPGSCLILKLSSAIEERASRALSGTDDLANYLGVCDLSLITQIGTHLDESGIQEKSLQELQDIHAVQMDIARRKAEKSAAKNKNKGGTKASEDGDEGSETEDGDEDGETESGEEDGESEDGMEDGDDATEDGDDATEDGDDVTEDGDDVTEDGDDGVEHGDDGEEDGGESEKIDDGESGSEGSEYGAPNSSAAKTKKPASLKAGSSYESNRQRRANESEYERTKRLNIERNNELLKALHISEDAFQKALDSRGINLGDDEVRTAIDILRCISNSTSELQ